ncbi:Congested-like trachea protein [Seminavis robusta]|uniref:Congested-like trachea protein n=1 Tax=Seminavis robusta TaxID=568900 RepID=A0A9N8DBL2_9STRA|nr:Congested-like trachea protein [Seminavis robusta]|eukprot:Sro46_g027310.1 Congested-like trachea protein (334) ;mRNA; r:18216-19523
MKAMSSSNSFTQRRFLMFSVVLIIALAWLSPAVMAKDLSPWMSNLHSFAGGGVGGICSVLVGHPLDLVKVRLQTAAASTKDDGKTPKRGTFGVLRDIVRKEGFGGLYRGVAAPLVAVAPIWAVSFWGFDTGDKIVRAMAGLAPGASLTIAQLCFAGGFSALPTALVMVPAERIKCLLQIQQQQQQGSKSVRQYNGFGDCAASLYRESGLAGLYKGTTLTLMRDIPGCMVYFGVYTVVKNALGPSPLSALIAGSLAGVSFWPVILPMDCLKSRYQTAPEGTYQNIGQVWSTLMDDVGPTGLFNGMGPAMIRAMPANAISFLGAELTKKALAGGV